MPKIYDYADCLTPGEKATLERTVYFCSDEDDITPFVETDSVHLEQRIAQSENIERQLYEKARAALNEWAEQAGNTLIMKRALEFQKTKLPEHTSNQWVETKDWIIERKISNLTYKFNVYLYKITKRERDADGNFQEVVVGYDVTWLFCTQGITGRYAKEIDGQNRKHYKDLESAEKYIAGRFKKYAGYFTELQPKIKPEYADHFKVGGVLLPGYELEEKS